MATKGNSDDYYASIKNNTDDTAPDTKKVVVKKLKVKAKKVVKKTSEKSSDDTKLPSSQKIESAPEPKKEEKVFTNDPGKVVFTARKISSAPETPRKAAPKDRSTQKDTSQTFRREKPAKKKGGVLEKETEGKKYKSSKKSKLRFKGAFHDG